MGWFMTARIAAAAALFAFALLVAPEAVRAQAAPGAAPSAAEAEKPARSGRKTKSTKEPTVGQMAARERQRKCAAEWKVAKAGGKLEAGTKWPQYWSKCNTRLKETKA